MRSQGLCLHFIADVVWWDQSGWSDSRPLGTTPLANWQWHYNFDADAEAIESGDSQWQWLAQNVHGITGYNPYTTALRWYGENVQYVKDQHGSSYVDAVETLYAAWQERSNQSDLPFHPVVQPGYDDRNLRGHDRPEVPRHGGYTYHKSWSLAKKMVHNPQQIVFITSFNEYFEGTDLDPTVTHPQGMLMPTRHEISAFHRAQGSTTTR